VIRSPAGMMPRRAQGVPSSWGTLMCLCRVLRPRRDRVHQAVAVVRRGPRSCPRPGLSRVVLSGLNSTAWALAIYASQGGLPHRHARLASGCWPGSAGWDWLPTGFLRKVLMIQSLHHRPLSPAFLAQGQFTQVLYAKRRAGRRSAHDARLQVDNRHGSERCGFGWRGRRSGFPA